MSEYIVLQEATHLCPYSQEYLSLRARQGKLKAVKLGRNWFCTREWLQEYIAKSESYKNSMNGNGKSHVVAIEPPRNLPVYAPDADMWEDNTEQDFTRRIAFARKLQFVFACLLVVALFFVSIFQGHQQFLRVAEKVGTGAISSAASLQVAANEKGFAIGSEMKSYFAAGVSEIAIGYVSWLGDHIRSIAKIIIPRPDYSRQAQQTTQGLVVVPSSASSADDEKVKEHIKQSFSDAVSITPYDADSGIITPIFRERKGEDYLYILVPLREGNSK